MNIGVLGLGVMGSALASQFSRRGHFVLGWTRRNVDNPLSSAIGAEQIAATALNARVIRSFNYSYADLLTSDVAFEGLSDASTMMAGEEAR
jgi:predicted dinucleotide-binding enzyme